jgi:hypothetical protein
VEWVIGLGRNTHIVLAEIVQQLPALQKQLYGLSVIATEIDAPAGELCVAAANPFEEAEYILGSSAEFVGELRLG